MPNCVLVRAVHAGDQQPCTRQPLAVGDLYHIRVYSSHAGHRLFKPPSVDFIINLRLNIKAAVQFGSIGTASACHALLACKPTLRV